MKKLIFVTVLALFISCGSETSDLGEASSSSDASTDSSSLQISVEDVNEWVSYMQSSDNGIWENDPLRMLSFTLEGDFPSGNSTNPVYFNPYDVCEYGSNLYITDPSSYQIIALDSDGNEVWSAGERGEGPGYFTMLTFLSVSDNYVAVVNFDQGRIDFLHRLTGEYSHSISVTAVQDIEVVSDSLFAAASTMEPGGAVHIIDPDLGIVRSFGSIETTRYNGIPRSDLIRLCSSASGELCLFNRYEGLLAIYDVSSGESIYTGSRNYPSTPRPPREVTDNQGNNRFLHFPIAGNAFTGPDGQLNIVICNVMDDGSFISDPEYLDFAPVTPIDRYDWAGNYLDTYCLPDSCINNVVCLNDGSIIGRSFAEGSLKLFTQYSTE